VLDNQKAVLEVGKTVPQETGSYASTGGNATVSPFNTIDQKAVTLKLEVTPQINLGASVGLAIALQNDSLANPDTPSLTPTINTSSIKNSVIVNTGDILVIGGLISNSSTETINKVPLLGDLPVIGRALFTQKSHKVQKMNLLVFIKPTILQSGEDATEITEAKYNFIRERQISWPQDLADKTQNQAPNILPLWKNNIALPHPFTEGGAPS